MEDLIKKLTQLEDLLKAIKQQSISMPSIPSLPALKQPPTPSMNAKVAQSKLPGMAPNAKKDPKKIAQQIKDGSMSTKTQKIMLKFDQNGQWSLEDVEKAQRSNKPHPKDPILNPDKYPPKAPGPEKLKELSTKLENYLKNKELKKEEVQSSGDEQEKA